MFANPSLIKRILVVKLAGIGDMLTAFPALEALRKTHGQAEITALVTPQAAPLLQGSGLTDRVIVLDKYVFDDARGFVHRDAPGRLAGLIGELHRGHFDTAILLHHLLTWPGVAKYAALMLSTGATYRVGLNDGRGRFLNLTARDKGFGAMHEVDYWLQVVGMLGATHPQPRIRLHWDGDEEIFARGTWTRLGLVGAPVVAIHPGTGSYSPVRRWLPERFSQLADALAADGFLPMVVAGPGEEELARQVVEGISSSAVLLEGVPTPRHLAAVLSRCRLFVGNDSGVMHVAVSAGVPVVAVFGPSNPRAWGPYDPEGRCSRVVRLNLPCSPCQYREQSMGLRYGCGDPRCLHQLSVGMVVKAARGLAKTAAGEDRPETC